LFPAPRFINAPGRHFDSAVVRTVDGALRIIHH
jgi:hypothetical protein